MKKIGKVRLIAIVVSLALLVLSVPIISFADDVTAPAETGWGDFEAQGDFEAWTENENTDQLISEGEQDADAATTVNPSDNGGPEDYSEDESSPEEDSKAEEAVEDSALVIDASATYDLLTDAYPEMRLGVSPTSWFGEPMRTLNGDVTEIEVGNMDLAGDELVELFDLDFLNFDITYTDGMGFTFDEFTGEVVMATGEEEADSGEQDEPNPEDETDALQLMPMSPPLGQSLIPEQLAVIKESMTIDFLFQDSSIKSGQTALLYPYITVKAGEGGEIEADRLTAILTFPEETWLDTATYANEWYDFETVEGKLVLHIKQLPPAGSGDGLPPIYLTTKNGVTDDGEQIQVSATVYYDTEELVTVEPECTITVDEFGWANPSSATNYPSGMVLSGTDELADVYLYYSATNNALAKTIGRAFTGELVVEEVVEVSEYIQLTQAILDAATMTYQNQTSATYSMELTPLTYHDAGNIYIKSFRVTYTMTNSSLAGATPADLNSFTNMRFLLKGMKVDKTKADTQIASGDTQYIIQNALKSDGMTITAHPSVDVNSANVTGGEQKVTAGTGYAMKVTYIKSTAIDPDDPDNPLNSGGITKKTTSVAGSSTRQYAYGGESITYTFTDFGNKLKTRQLTDFRVTDEIDRDDLYPLSITSGAYSTYSTTYYTINIWMDGDTTTPSYKITTARFSSNTNYPLTSYIGSSSLSDITKIEFVYGNVPAGFKVSTAPTITMVARTKAPDDTDSTLTNTVRLSYAATIEGTTTKYPDDAGEADQYVSVSEVAYYHEVEEEDKLNKDVIKLRGSTGTGKAVDDLLEYTVLFRNTSGQVVQNPFFDDTYVGQEPYLVDTLGTLGAYDTAPFIKIVSVTNASGVNVSADRGLSISSYYNCTSDGSNDPGHHSGLDPEMTANTLRIRLSGKLQHGDTVKVSYVMRVTSPSEVRNSFKAWAYPIGSGSAIIYLGNGYNKPGAVSKVNPTLSSAIVVTNRPSDVVNVSAVTGAAKDEEVEIQLTLSNTAPYYGGSVTLNSFLQDLYRGGTSYQDLLAQPTSNASIVHYNSGGTAIDTRASVPYTISPGVSFSTTTSATSTSYLRGGFLLDGSPMELQPGEKVVLTYRMTVSDWPVVSKNLYQYLVSYATLQNTTSEISTSTSSIGSTYDGNTTTKSRYSMGGRYIYFKRNSGMYAGIGSGVSSTGPILNGSTLFSGRTAYMYLYNYTTDETLSVSKAIVRMPEHETFKAVTTSGYKYEVISAAGEQQVVAISRTDGSDITLAPNASASSSMTIAFTTEMTAVNNQKLVEKDNPTSLSYSYYLKSQYYYVGFYSNQTVLTTNANPLAAESNSGGEWGTAQTGTLYRSTSTYTMSAYALYASPGITAQPMKISASDTYEAITSSDTITIGQRIAWQVTVREFSNSYTLPTLTTPYVVIKLPVGMAYGGKTTGAQAVNTYDIGGQTYVVAKLDNVTNATARTITVESTGSTSYGDMQAEVYLVSNDLFYNVYSNSGSNTAYGTRVARPFTYTELGIPSTAFQDYVLSTSAKINVTGLFAFASTMKVQLDGGATAISTGNDTVESPRDGKNFTYTMTLKNGGNTLPYEDLVIINRMPAKDDKYNMSAAAKGSNTPVTMQTAPIVKLDGATLSAGSDYTLSYTSAAPNHTFTHGDYGSGTASTSWSATMASATAFRVELTNPLAAGKTLEITFQAKADPSGIPYKNAIAVDTFGFGFNASITNDPTWVTSEAVPVKITFPNLNPAVITGTLFEDDNTDGILNGSESGYTGGAVQLQLINAANVAVQTTSTNPADGTYRFEIETPGAYTVKIVDLPSGYAIFDTLKTEAQGNKFKHDTLTTEAITVVIEQTYIANAALVPDVAGELTITKTVTGDSWVGGVNQSFLFRIDYTPVGTSNPITFYEVIKGPGSRTVAGLPRGTYTVTEISDWSTGFSPVGGAVVGGLEITYTQPTVSAAFTNKREVENYFHAIADATNKFSS